MFRKDKMYSGEIANSMVQGMVVNYKQRIKKLHDSNTELQQENKNLRTENTELQMINDQLETDNQAMLRTITELRSAVNRKSVDRMEREIEMLKGANLSLVKENAELKKELERAMFRTQSKGTSESPWDYKRSISSYPISDTTEIRFDFCKHPDGSEYIDARKYVTGLPTKKGICLKIEDFETFLRMGRTAWSRVVSGLFNYRNRRF